MFLKIQDTLIDTDAVAYVRRFRNESSPLNIRETYGLKIGIKNSEASVMIPFQQAADAAACYHELCEKLQAVSL